MKSAKPTLRATVFTDYICPFCYIGDVRLERLRAEYDLKISWCFIEIHPDTPPEGSPVGELGYSDERWKQMMGNLERLASEDGIPLRSHDFTTNSHKSLLLAEAAKEAGAEIFYRLHRRLFEAFFTDGLNIGDETVLTGLAVESGVPPDIISHAWGEPRYEERLRQYLAAAVELNVRATPTIFFGQQQRLDGALPYSEFLKAARAGEVEQQAPPA